MKRRKPYWEMTTEELREATKRYDREELGLPGKPLTRADQTLHARAARKRGRPLVGQGAKRVLVSIERGVLDQADATARKLRISRSELITRGIREVIAKVA